MFLELILNKIYNFLFLKVFIGNFLFNLCIFLVARTDSPDNDSAFSDNVSMLSSESSASSGASGGAGGNRHDPNKHPSQVLKSFIKKIQCFCMGTYGIVG